MTTYAVAHIAPKDPETFARYRDAAGAALAKHGGRVVQVAAAPFKLEGCGPVPKAMALLEFPSAAAARAWHGDPGLADTHRLRTDGADVTLIVLANPADAGATAG